MLRRDHIPAAEVLTMLVLSTAHLRESTCCTWMRNHCTAAHEKPGVGWFVYVCDNPSHDTAEYVPNELLLCLEFARERGHEWIMFDCDGPLQDGLVVYDW